MKTRFALPLVVCCSVPLLSPGHTQSFPNCSSSTSDSDGDGYGWENNQTCIVVQQLQCEDRGDYPWGWNPQTLTSCRLDTETPSTADSCSDGDGDGWGWNGQTSCRGNGSQVMVNHLTEEDGVRITTPDVPFGTSVAPLGDINEDGYADVMLAGFDRIAVVYGAADSHSTADSIDSLDGSDGFRINLEPFLNGGTIKGVASGFMDGDSKLDAIISMSINGSSEAGSPYLIFILYGDALSDHTSAQLELESTSPFGILGASNLGGWITGLTPNSDGIDAADFNADGFDDLLINATGSNDRVATVIFGGPTLLEESTVYYMSSDWADLDGTNGLKITDSGSANRIGPKVRHIGDVNADGIDDLVVLLSRFDNTLLSFTDDVAVIFGQHSFSDTLDVASLDGSNGFIVPAQIDDGISEVSGLGDINGDGIDDFGISVNQGFTIVFGSADAFPEELSLQDSLGGGRAFLIESSENNKSLHHVGDVTGDGISDILFGVGTVHLLTGRNDWPDTVSSLDASTTYTLNGSKGSSLGGELGTGKAGDINGDGVNDLIISAPWNYCLNFQCQEPFPGGVVGLIYGQVN